MEFLVVCVDDTWATEVPSPFNWIAHLWVDVMIEKFLLDDETNCYPTKDDQATTAADEAPDPSEDDAFSREKAKVGAWEGRSEAEINGMLTLTTLPLTWGQEGRGGAGRQEAINNALTFAKDTPEDGAHDSELDEMFELRFVSYVSLK